MQMPYFSIVNKTCDIKTYQSKIYSVHDDMRP